MKNTLKDSIINLAIATTATLAFGTAALFGGYATPDAATQAPAPITVSQQTTQGITTIKTDNKGQWLQVLYYRMNNNGQWEHVSGGFKYTRMQQHAQYDVTPLNDDGGYMLAVWYVYSNGIETARGSHVFDFGR